MIYIYIYVCVFMCVLIKYIIISDIRCNPWYTHTILLVGIL